LSLALAGPALAAEPPTVTNIMPHYGPTAGGTSVTITGTNFTGANAVKFGTSNAASFTVNSTTVITATSPPLVGETHTVNVTVTTPAGTSTVPNRFADEFHYHFPCEEGQPPPAVTSVEPRSGLAETKVRIKGERFGSEVCGPSEHPALTRVWFGFIESPDFGFVKENEVEAVSPLGTGIVDVTVEDALGQSPVTPSDKFTNVNPNYRWYRSGVLLPEGESVPVVTFGGETNLSAPSALGELNCRFTGGGIVENPVGGGAGDGKSNAGGFYECKAPECEAEVKAKTGLDGRGTATLQNQPSSTKEPAFPGWTNLLEESTVAGVLSIREKIGEPFVTFKEHSPPGMIRMTVDCTIAANQQVVAETIFEGELKPEIGAAKNGNTNGTSASKPSSVRFGAGAKCPGGGAELCPLHSSIVVGGGTWTGSLKYLGYNEQELITVKP
jgi:hypothetical protein